MFDVLGQLTFEDRQLRELLLEAIRYGDQPEVKARLYQKVDRAVDREHLRELVEGRSLTHDVMDLTKVREIREEMERAEARRLQPHFIASFFLEAFRLLGGTIHERETNRYDVKHVPSQIRSGDRAIGRGAPVLTKYERIAFDKSLINLPGKPLAAFVCPGHPLLNATLDLILERYRDLLKRGAVLVDDTDDSDKYRVMLFLEYSIQDARTDRSGNRRVVSKRLQFVEIDSDGNTTDAGPAPYLDYRPLSEDERATLSCLSLPEWIRGDLESRAQEYAAVHLVPRHLDEVRRRKEELIDKTKAAVQERLTKEINYWDHRTVQLKDQELAGKVNAKINSGAARQRADKLTSRLQTRLTELGQERRLSALPPVVLGGLLIIPRGVFDRLRPNDAQVGTFATETDMSELLAMNAVMQAERDLGFKPVDVSEQKLGYDVESSDPNSGRLRFIEVKGRIVGATTVTISKNEILTGLNKPDDFILAIVLIDGAKTTVRYCRTPFDKEPDFKATSVNYDLAKLLAQSKEPA